MSKTAKCIVALPVGGQVKNEAVQAIIERMGITKAAIFLRENMSQPIDYLEIKEKLFAKAPAAEIYAAIKAK
jgi:hypothetical protein